MHSSLSDGCQFGGFVQTNLIFCLNVAVSFCARLHTTLVKTVRQRVRCSPVTTEEISYILRCPKFVLSPTAATRENRGLFFPPVLAATGQKTAVLQPAKICIRAIRLFLKVDARCVPFENKRVETRSIQAESWRAPSEADACHEYVSSRYFRNLCAGRTCCFFCCFSPNSSP